MEGRPARPVTIYEGRWLRAAIRVHPQVSGNATGPSGPDGKLRESSMMRAEV